MRILMILMGLLLGFVALDWSSTPSTECGTRLATVEDTDEIGSSARQVEVAVVQLSEVVLAPFVISVAGKSDLACRWSPRSLFALLAFLCLGYGMKKKEGIPPNNNTLPHPPSPSLTLTLPHPHPPSPSLTLTLPHPHPPSPSLTLPPPPAPSPSLTLPPPASPSLTLPHPPSPSLTLPSRTCPHLPHNTRRPCRTWDKTGRCETPLCAIW